jgi:hypothetical protein
VPSSATMRVKNILLIMLVKVAKKVFSNVSNEVLVVS